MNNGKLKTLFLFYDTLAKVWLNLSIIISRCFFSKVRAGLNLMAVSPQTPEILN